MRIIREGIITDNREVWGVMADIKDKFQVLYKFRGDDTTYPTFIFAEAEIADYYLDVANKYFRRNGAKHFLGKPNEYIDPGEEFRYKKESMFDLGKLVGQKERLGL